MRYTYYLNPNLNNSSTTRIILALILSLDPKGQLLPRTLAFNLVSIPNVNTKPRRNRQHEPYPGVLKTSIPFPFPIEIFQERFVLTQTSTRARVTV